MQYSADFFYVGYSLVIGHKINIYRF